jgi:hypothetical protein
VATLADVIDQLRLQQAAFDPIRDLLQQQLTLAQAAYQLQQQQGGTPASGGTPTGTGPTRGGAGRAFTSLIQHMFPQPRGLIGRIGQGMNIVRSIAAVARGGSSAATAAGGGSGAAAGAGTAAGSIGAAAAGIIIIIAAVAAALTILPGKIQKWAAELLESQRHLAKFSASMAQVFAIRDIRVMLREQRIGEATARTTGALAKAEQDLADINEPWDIMVANFKNSIMTDLAGVGKTIGGFRNYILGIGDYRYGRTPEGMGKAREEDEKKREEASANPLQRWINDLADRAAGAPAGADPRAFQPGFAGR